MPKKLSMIPKESRFGKRSVILLQLRRGNHELFWNQLFDSILNKSCHALWHLVLIIRTLPFHTKVQGIQSQRVSIHKLAFPLPSPRAVIFLLSSCARCKSCSLYNNATSMKNGRLSLLRNQRHNCVMCFFLQARIRSATTLTHTQKRGTR